MQGEDNSSKKDEIRFMGMNFGSFFKSCGCCGNDRDEIDSISSHDQRTKNHPRRHANNDFGYDHLNEDRQGSSELGSSTQEWTDIEEIVDPNDPNLKVSYNYEEEKGDGADPNEPLDFDYLRKLSGSDEGDKAEGSLSSHSKKIAKKEKPAKIAASEENDDKEETSGKAAKRRPWQPHEDAKVIELVRKYGQSWALISSMMNGRTGKQIRDRYLNKLKPDIKKGDWTPAEDSLLLQLYYQVGHKWSQIARHLPGRTEGQVKNRFYSHHKKKILKYEGLDRQKALIQYHYQNSHPQMQQQNFNNQQYQQQNQNYNNGNNNQQFFQQQQYNQNDVKYEGGNSPPVKIENSGSPDMYVKEEIPQGYINQHNQNYNNNYNDNGYYQQQQQQQYPNHINMPYQQNQPAIRISPTTQELFNRQPVHVDNPTDLIQYDNSNPGSRKISPQNGFATAQEIFNSSPEQDPDNQIDSIIGRAAEFYGNKMRSEQSEVNAESQSTSQYSPKHVDSEKREALERTRKNLEYLLEQTKSRLNFYGGHPGNGYDKTDLFNQDM